jgi:hypothetical protein
VLTLIQGNPPVSPPVSLSLADIAGVLNISINGGAYAPIGGSGGTVLLPDGSAASPALRFASEPGANTGFFYAGDGVWGFSSDSGTQFFMGGAFGIRMLTRVNEARGGNIASASNITLTSGNFFHVTGVTTIDRIESAGWLQPEITLMFDGALTLNHNTALSGTLLGLRLVGATNASMAAGSKITLRLDDTTSQWVEVSRSGA